MKSFKEIWESRNPFHEINLDTGEDMFWKTAQMVAEEFCGQKPQAGAEMYGELYRWVKASEREPKIGDYYFCKVDTKNDCIVETIVEWGEHKNGDYKYDDWDLDNVSHFGDFSEDAEVIAWLEKVEAGATSSSTVKNLESRIKDLEEVLSQCDDYFDNYADADYIQEQYSPNPEMALLAKIRQHL